MLIASNGREISSFSPKFLATLKTRRAILYHINGLGFHLGVHVHDDSHDHVQHYHVHQAHKGIEPERCCVLVLLGCTSLQFNLDPTNYDR